MTRSPIQKFEKLIGEEVVSIYFKPTSFSVCFWDTCLEVSGAYVLTSGRTGEIYERRYRGDLPVRATSLLRLLMVTLRGVSVKEEGGLKLEFSNDDVLEVDSGEWAVDGA